MPIQSLTDVDPQTGATTPEQGTAAAVDDQGGKGTDTGATSAATLDEAAQKVLDDLLQRDPATLPQSFLDKYVPKPEFTRGRQEFAEERKAFEAERAAHYELMRRLAAERPPQGPSPQEQAKKQLEELAQAGDFEAQRKLVEMEAEEKIAPYRAQMALQNAQASAMSNPLAKEGLEKHWNEIVQTLQTDPVLGRMASIDNFAHADKVMMALGLEARVKDLVPQRDSLAKENAGLKAKIAAMEKERVAGLPSSTTKAGTTSGRPAPGKVETREEKLLRIWRETGHREEDFG